jgi:hypothetical protein
MEHFIKLSGLSSHDVVLCQVSDCFERQTSTSVSTSILSSGYDAKYPKMLLTRNTSWELRRGTSRSLVCMF